MGYENWHGELSPAVLVNPLPPSSMCKSRRGRMVSLAVGKSRSEGVTTRSLKTVRNEFSVDSIDARLIGVLLLLILASSFIADTVMMPTT